MKKFFCLFFSLLVTFSFCVPAFANDSFVAEPAVPYYFEESTAYGRNALSIVDNLETRAALEKKMLEEDLILLGVATKRVYVSEETNALGQKVSRLMTPAEVNNLKSTTQNPATATEGTLTITLSSYTNSRYQTIVDGRADWAYTSSVDGETTPAALADTLSIEWGGNESLVAVSCSCSGLYYNNIKLSTRCSYANSYGGYSWEFDEKDSTNGNAKYIWGTVVLGLASGSLQNRQTSATLIYNHTYLVNNGVTSNYPDDWSISVEVDGITY